jgi:hypothetical protein
MGHFSENIEAHVDGLVDIMNKIPSKGVTILTGSNGSGKSLIRNQFIFQLAKRAGIDIKNYKGKIGSVSMQKRTESNPEWSALSSCMHDTSWTPTSLNTIDLIDELLIKDFEYYVIDEPEIGMGEEVVMSLVDYLNDKISEHSERGYLVITHNRYIVENLNADNFFNCDGIKTKEEWINRPLVKADLKILKENKLFDYIRDKNKK